METQITKGKPINHLQKMLHTKAWTVKPRMKPKVALQHADRHLPEQADMSTPTACVCPVTTNISTYTQTRDKIGTTTLPRLSAVSPRMPSKQCQYLSGWTQITLTLGGWKAGCFLSPLLFPSGNQYCDVLACLSGKDTVFKSKWHNVNSPDGWPRAWDLRNTGWSSHDGHLQQRHSTATLPDAWYCQVSAGLVGLVSACCDWVRQKVWSATSFSEW